MIRFICKRLLYGIPIVFFMSFVTLFLINLAPGNYFEQLRLNPQITEDVIRQYEENFKLDENVIIQYLSWLKNVCFFNFGYSFSYQAPVKDLIVSRLWNTFLLSFVTFIVSWGVAIPLGLYAAYKRDNTIDILLRSLSYVFLSIPSFFFAIIVLFFCAYWTNIPIGGMRSIRYDEFTIIQKIYDVGLHLLVPVCVLSAATASYLFRIVRSNAIEVLNTDFVRVLHARGISHRVIVYKHILRNAVNPLITMLGYQLPVLFSGAALVEIITGWPGLGKMMLFAVRSQDIFLVMGNMLMLSFLLIAGNIFADILLVINDPRIRET